jgi:hypothetical protein
MRTSLIAVGAVCVLALATPTARADTATWPFDLTTHGEDIHWVSSTAISNVGDYYVMSYHITQLVVTVKYLIFNFDLDVTSQIPAEMLNGSSTYFGPPPIICVDEYLVYPPPPDPPAIEVNLAIGLNDSGHGFSDATNIYLGKAQVDLGPPWGVVTVDIKAIRLVGTLTGSAYQYMAGDANCDGYVDGFDIDPFFFALQDPDAWYVTYPYCSLENIDVNGDGYADGFDIDPFFVLLQG